MTDISQPIVAVQNAVTPAQIPVAMAILIFFQNFSTSIAGVVSNTIFAQTLTAKIAEGAPHISPDAALKAGSGASAVRGIVSPGHEDELAGLLSAYANGLENIFCFLVGLAVLASAASFGLGGRDVRKTKVQTTKHRDDV